MSPVRNVAAALLGALFLAGAPAAPDERPPNLVLIVADDLGWGDLSCQGQASFETPRLDRLAAQGRRYTDFYAGSTVCAPSRCVLMTGLHTGHCLVRGNKRLDLRPDDVTLAEVLGAAGYRTGLVGKWGLGSEGGAGQPTRQGFEHFFGYLDQRHAHNFYPTFLLRGEERVALDNVVPNEGADGAGEASERNSYSHDLFTDEALALIEAWRDEPFFLYLAYTIPHANNEAGPRGMEVPELGEFADSEWADPEKGFAAMVARLDRDVGRIVDRIDELGLGDDTLILFTSDNGPHSEGGHRADAFDSNGPLRGIKRSLHDGGIRVPTIARWSGHVPAETVSDHVAGFQDVLPTFAALAGAEEHVPDGLDGLAFTDDLAGRDEAQATHDHLYWAFFERGSGRALRRDAWKLVQQPFDSAPRLYDLSRDLGEEHDLAADHPELVEELLRAMDEAYVASEHWRFPD